MARRVDEAGRQAGERGRIVVGDRTAEATSTGRAANEWLQHNFPLPSHSSRNALAQGYETWCALAGRACAGRRGCISAVLPANWLYHSYCATGVDLFAGAAASVCWPSDPHPPHLYGRLCRLASEVQPRRRLDAKDQGTHGRGAGAAAVSIDNQSAIASLDGEHGCRERVSTRCAPSSTLVCGCRRPIVKAQDPWDAISHEPPAQLSSTRGKARASERVCLRGRGRGQGSRRMYLVTS